MKAKNVNIQERFLIKSGLWWRAYGSWNMWKFKIGCFEMVVGSLQWAKYLKLNFDKVTPMYMWALLFILGILNVKQDQICSNCSPKVVALKLLEFISRAGLFSSETIKNPNFSSEIMYLKIEHHLWTFPNTQIVYLIKI